MVQRILNDDSLDYNAVGFLDDDPQLEGRRINGYQIFGGHWKLQGILNTTKIEEVLISSDSMKPEVLRRLSTVTRANGVALRRLSIQLEVVETPQKQQQAISHIEERFAIVGK